LPVVSLAEATAHLLLSGAIIAAGGWVWETIYCSLASRHLERRGMLYGPTCPIYGVSAIVVWLALGWVEDTLLLFLLGCILSTVLEYTSGAMLERRFNRRWWDYSMFPGNFRGLVCPQASSVFGLFAVIDVKILQPSILGTLSTADQRLCMAAAALCLALYAADLLFTIAHLDKTTPRECIAEHAGQLRRLVLH